MEIITSCKYNGMSFCTARTWKEQNLGCTFAVKSASRHCCQHYGLKDDETCDCLEAQKIAYKNFKNKK